MLNIYDLPEPTSAAHCAKLAHTLELIIDREGLARTIEIIATICQEKDDHLGTAWQDAPAGRAWRKAGNRLMALAARRDFEI